MIYFSRDEVEKIGMAGAGQHPDGAWRYLSSFWLYVEDGDKAFSPHVRKGYWEAWVTAWASQQFDDHDIFVDVGANVGYYSMLAATHGLTTIAIEPNPIVAKLLRKSARLNGVRVTTYIQALSDEIGTGTLYIPEQHSGGAYLTGGKGIPVHISRMDTQFHFDSAKRVLVKIDAEGSEPKIWAGMKEVLENSKVTTFLEWESHRYDPQEFANALFEQPYVGMIEFDGTETQLNWNQLVRLQGLQTIVVRNYEYSSV